MAPATDELVYNPYAFSVHDDPYVTYRRLRDEQPAYWNPELRFWVLSRFDDVLEAFRDFETFSSAGGIALENRRPVGTPAPGFEPMIELDPPEHTAFRKLVARVFTTRKVAQMESEIRGIVDHYIDTVIDAGHCDLVADITGPFPMDVISALLGIPESDRELLRRHADQILIRDDGSMVMPAAALEGMFGLIEYFVNDLPRRTPGDGSGIISDLLGLEVEGRSLTNEELLGFCILFVIAGHETTTKMVANTVELLSRHPEQRARLLADPGLVPGAVEEVLRFHNSTQYMHRTLTRTTFALFASTAALAAPVQFTPSRDIITWGVTDADDVTARKTPALQATCDQSPALTAVRLVQTISNCLSPRTRPMNAGRQVCCVSGSTAMMPSGASRLW